MNSPKDEPNVIRLRLTGDQALRGRIPSADVGRLLLGAERVIAHAVGHVRGKQLKERGGWGKVVEDAVAFRFIRIEDGSFVAVIGVPDLISPDPRILEAATLTEVALDGAIALANGTDGDREWHDVATAFVDWVDDLGIGTRYESLQIDHRSRQGTTSATLNLETRARLQKTAASPHPPHRTDRIVGRLVEADFERDTARLRTPAGQKVEVGFDPTQEDAVQEALRREASISGEVTLDPTTARPKAVRLERIETGEQLQLGIGATELPPQRSIEELAQDRQVKPLSRNQNLRLRSIHDDEIDDYFAALASLDD
jgi:hypothetical protein